MVTHPKLFDEKSGWDVLGCASAPETEIAATAALAIRDFLRTHPITVALLRWCGPESAPSGPLAPSAIIGEVRRRCDDQTAPSSRHGYSDLSLGNPGIVDQSSSRGSEISLGGGWHCIRFPCGRIDIVLGTGYFQPGIVVFVVIDQRRPRRGEGAGIVHLHRNIEIVGVTPAITLHDVQLVRMRRGELVHPASRIQPDGV